MTTRLRRMPGARFSSVTDGSTPTAHWPQWPARRTRELREAVVSRTILRWPVLNWRLLAGSLFASSNGERFDSWEALYRSGLLACDQGRFAEARQQLEAALSHSELSMQDVRRAEIYCSLAYVYQTLGEQPKADFHYSAAQSIIGNHTELETSVLATILSEIGLYRLE